MADTNFQPGTIVASSWLDDVNTNTYAVLSAVSAGPNNITANAASTVTVGYPRGVAFRFIPQATNTGPMTINISGLGVKNLTKMGTTPLRANDVLQGAWAYIAYDGTQFQLINPMTDAVGQLIGTQRFLSTAVYTPTPGTNSIIIDLLGAGGGGGGTPATAAGQVGIGSGGGSGGYVRSRITSGFAGQTVTVGNGGSGGVGGNGSSGGNSLFMGLTAGGGTGGNNSAGAVVAIPGGVGGTAFGGNLLNVPGQTANDCMASFAASVGWSGQGGSTLWGSGGYGQILQSGTIVNNGVTASGFGSGGGGARAGQAQPAGAGGGGQIGIAIIYEYS